MLFFFIKLYNRVFQQADAFCDVGMPLFLCLLSSVKFRLPDFHFETEYPLYTSKKR